MDRHGIVLVLVSWTPLSTWHFTCVIIHATCMNYGQYYACRCLVQRLHPAMGRHSIVLRTCKLNSTIYMAFDLCYHPCRMHELWSIPCLPMPGAETASSHGQTRHSKCKNMVSRAWLYVGLRIIYMIENNMLLITPTNLIRKLSSVVFLKAPYLVRCSF